MKKITILILNGPNLNLTGQRETDHYGSQSFESLPEILQPIKVYCPGLEVRFMQSNHEGDLVDQIQQATAHQTDGIVINPGAFTHTSVAIADALRATPIPCIEVHLSHVYTREEFRRHNLVAASCLGSISGLGLIGYKLAVDYLVHQHHHTCQP